MKCELCEDTGWYGGNGPGRRGNAEYIPCEICNPKADGDYVVLGEVEALKAENQRLKEMLYAIADAKSTAVMQSSVKLFREWYENEKKKGFNLA